jgi:hypothetical protein
MLLCDLDHSCGGKACRLRWQSPLADVRRGFHCYEKQPCPPDPAPTVVSQPLYNKMTMMTMMTTPPPLSTMLMTMMTMLM